MEKENIFNSKNELNNKENNKNLENTTEFYEYSSNKK